MVIFLGLDVLTAIEKVQVDEKEKPIQEIILKSVSIFVDPFKEVDDFLENQRKQIKEEIREEKKPIPQHRSGVGSFVDLSQIITPSSSGDDPSGSSSSAGEDKKSNNKKTKSSSQFGNFGNW